MLSGKTEARTSITKSVERIFNVYIFLSLKCSKVTERKEDRNVFHQPTVSTGRTTVRWLTSSKYIWPISEKKMTEGSWKKIVLKYSLSRLIAYFADTNGEIKAIQSYTITCSFIEKIKVNIWFWSKSLSLLWKTIVCLVPCTQNGLSYFLYYFSLVLYSLISCWLGNKSNGKRIQSLKSRS